MANMVNAVTDTFFEIQTRPILVLPFVSDYETRLNITHPVSGIKQKQKLGKKDCQLYYSCTLRAEATFSLCELSC